MNTDWVIKDVGNDTYLRLGNGDLVVFGDKEEAIEDMRGNETLEKFDVNKDYDKEMR